MDVMMLPEKKAMYSCKYAAPSVLTGNFVAYIYEATEEEIRETLTDPGPIVVYNQDTGSHTYSGYTTVDEIRPQEDGLIVILTNGGESDGEL